jgi:XTP/dITP diphosphohydrolase
MPVSSRRSVNFATSNEGKVLEARIILKPFGLSVRPFSGKGEEIQGDTTEVAAYSAREAARKYRKEVLVEDAGLFVDDLKGFPGPFSSYVFKTIGIEGLLVLLGSSKSRAAAFHSAVAYCVPDGEPRVFEGIVKGTIASSPRGENGFGFDPVFIPDGGRRSMGELSLEEKCALSHRGEAMRKFATWYEHR